MKRWHRCPKVSITFKETGVHCSVRVAFGIKGLAWKSVIIPRILPKPDLMPLTGGYRKTPVLQIGADKHPVRRWSW